MALKKHGRGGVDAPRAQATPSANQPDNDVEQRRSNRQAARRQQAADRIASSASELAAGIAEAASAQTELGQSMRQIAEGAEEALQAAKDAVSAMQAIGASLSATETDTATTEQLSTELEALIERVAGEIRSRIANVKAAADRQDDSVGLMAELEELAGKMGEAVDAVIRIADQTNLLALNAAIEAARAGVHGKGFAVVADVVRKLAETSASNAANIAELIRDVQGRAKNIAESVKGSATAARDEATKSSAIIDELVRQSADMAKVVSAAQGLASRAKSMSEAATQALDGAQRISSAASEQSTACQEAVGSLEQQAEALSEAERASEELGVVSGELRHSNNIGKSAGEIATAAEELAATMEELARSAGEIQAASLQIAEANDVQNQLADQSLERVKHIAQGAEMSETEATAVVSQCSEMKASLAANREKVQAMIAAVSTANEAGKANLVEILELQSVAGQIDKIVDAIANVALQTSMLAVSGAVEAARAGEHGKGFAVVSTDIQNLADEAIENAEEIKGQVKAIQSRIGQAQKDLETISANVAEEVEKAQSTTTSLGTIEDDMQRVLESNERIKQAAAEIGTATEQASRGSEQIAAAAQESARATEQNAEASRTQSSSVQELTSTVEALAALADELQSA